MNRIVLVEQNRNLTLAPAKNYSPLDTNSIRSSPTTDLFKMSILPPSVRRINRTRTSTQEKNGFSAKN